MVVWAGLNGSSAGETVPVVAFSPALLREHLAPFPSRRVPPRTDPGHPLVIAFHDLNGRATCTHIRHSRRRRSDIFKQALVAPEAADRRHFHRRCRLFDLFATPAALNVNLG